ncbi:GNAT family N-acetyltransferase [Actinomadura spongiicola]|uniref:GNAT family N-acetyltransferase n=1 Tax=Actinomadura spongiicola TaxID=2303421 RepID=UPI0018F17C48|nr:GNAT family protein [Actinomadura spongiicola]
MNVALRPLEAADLPVFDHAYGSPDASGEHQWFGFSPPGRSLAEMGALGPRGGRLTVTADGRVVGSVFWFRREWGPPDTSWCWEVALHILAEERRRGVGTRSMILLTRYLFDHTLAWRVQAIADVANTPSRRMLTRVGFTEEGVLRAAQWREGRRHDQVIYSLLRDERGP